ncbi:MAG: hypothetical protein WCA35_19970 [Kovacikia sp.]
MRLRVARTIPVTLLLLGTAFATVAQAQEGLGEVPPTQTPVQVIVQIVVTAIVLNVLSRFNLP